VGTQKYGLGDVRDILERASARETAARVAGGAVAKALLYALGAQVFSHVVQIAGVAAPRIEELSPEDFTSVDESPVRCLDSVARAWMKPLPTLTKPLRSVDIATHEPAEALRERTDSCTVPAAAVVGEAMVAFVLAGAYRRKFGGDHIDDVREAVGAFKERIGW